MNPRTSFTFFFSLILISTFSQESKRTIIGKVSSEGKALPGAFIVVHGTRIGTQSDIKGEFELQIPVQDTIIIYASYLSEPQYYYVFSKTDKLKIRLGRNKKESELIKKELLMKWESENQLHADSVKYK